jgi:hypothetical protein
MKKTYFFPPNFDYPPDGFLWPGRIFKKPFEPGTCLNRDPLPAYPADCPLQESKKIDWKGDEERTRSGLFSIWIRFLEFLGIEASGTIHWAVAHSNLYTIKKLETKFFEPSDEYLEQNMLHPAVASYIVKTDFQAPVYMVTGVKVAYGAGMAWENQRTLTVAGKMGGGGPAAGSPASGGTETQVQDSTKKATGYRHSSPFVFAYQIREIYYTKNLELVDKSFDKQAVLYSLDHQAQSTDGTKKPEVTPYHKVGGLGSEEETMKKLAPKVEDSLDEDGEECLCLAPPATPIPAPGPAPPPAQS